MPRTKTTARRNVKARKAKRAVGYNPRLLASSTGARTIVPRTEGMRNIQVMCRNLGSVSSNSGGSLFPTCGLLFNALIGSDQWAAYSAIYDQFLVESVTLAFIPHNRYSKSVVSTTSAVLAVDWDDLTVAIKSAKELLAIPNSRAVSLEDPWELTYTVPADIGMVSADVGKGWRDCSASSSFRGAYYIDAFINPSANTTFGDFYFTFSVRFRGQTD